ncbi:MAG: helix-turn-helix transcriptional regulator [Solirubrobacterales bacterium]
MKSKSIQLSANSYALLALLDHLGEATSYDIKQALEMSIENFWPLPHTTAYEEPARLAAGGYLSVRQEQGGRRRKLYLLTDEGRAALAAWTAEPSVAPPQLRDEAMLKVFAGAEPEALMDLRVAWHRGKLEELEGYLSAIGETGASTGGERALIAGVGYHRKMLEMIDELGEPS